MTKKLLDPYVSKLVMKDVTFFIESTEYLVSARVLGNVSKHT